MSRSGPCTPDTRPGGLTLKQITIITENQILPLADIQRLPGLEGVGVWQIKDRLTALSANPHADLARLLETYIRRYGLPAKYGCVIDYIRYLRGRPGESGER